jgi:hypothetical protein
MHIKNQNFFLAGASYIRVVLDILTDCLLKIWIDSKYTDEVNRFEELEVACIFKKNLVQLDEKRGRCQQNTETTIYSAAPVIFTTSRIFKSSSF